MEFELSNIKGLFSIPPQIVLWYYCYMRPSGKFVVRVSPELHAQLQETSRARGLSLNELCRNRLAQEAAVQRVPGARLSLSHVLLKDIASLPLPVEGIILFGSKVRGDATAASDTDLLIVLNSTVPVSRNNYSVWDERLKKHATEIRELNLVPHFANLPASPTDGGSLWLEVSLNGHILWEKEPARIGGFLYALREAIAEGQFQRKISHGHPYWVRRGDEE